MDSDVLLILPHNDISQNLIYIIFNYEIHAFLRLRHNVLLPLLLLYSQTLRDPVII